MPRQPRAALVCHGTGRRLFGETPTTPYTTEDTTTTDVFIGAVSVGETLFHTFAVTASGNAEITLGSLTASGQLVTTPVTVAVGTPAEGACTVLTSVMTRPALTANLSYAVTAGTYCVSLADTNASLAGTATVQRSGGAPMTSRRYLARAALALTLATAACDSDTPTNPTEATPTATTETFTGNVQRRGATSRSFRTSAEGVITASLASLGQDGARSAWRSD